jgi:O-antigen/teichoic acid export membrane protein
VISGGASGREQVRHGLIYLLPVAVGNLLPVVTLPIFTRILSPEDYGAWALTAAYAAFMTSLANMGLPSAYERNFYEYLDSSGRGILLYSTLAFVAAALVFCGVVTWVFREPVAHALGVAGHGDLVFWAYAAAAVMSVRTYCLAYFRNTQDARSYVWFSIDETVLGMAASLIAVAYLRLGVIGIVWGQLAASTAVTALMLGRFLRMHRPVFDRRVLLESLALGFPLTPRIFVNVLGSQLDKYLIGLVSSVGNVGLYAIGQRVANFVFAYMTALENVYVPQVYRRMFQLGESGAAEVGRYLTPFAYVSLAVALLIVLLAEEMLALLTTPAFDGAAPVAALLSVAYALMFFRKQPQLLFRRRTFTITLFSTAATAINVAVSVPLILRWGALGAAAGAAVSAVLAGAVHFVVSQRAYRIDYEAALVPMFLVVAAAAVTMVVAEAAAAPYWLRIAAKGAWMAAFVWTGLHGGVLTRENLALARDAVRGRFRPQHA